MEVNTYYLILMALKILFILHQSILAIKENVLTPDFWFNNVTLKDIENEISNLNSSKQGTFNNIPTKCLKESSDICSKYLLNIWNNENEMDIYLIN